MVAPRDSRKGWRIMRLKKVVAGLLAGAMLCSVAGCSSNPQKVELKNPDGTLKVYYQNNTNTRSAIDEFAKEHPNLNLELEGFSNLEEMDNRISTEMNSGQGPDVMVMNLTTSLDLNKMMSGKNLLDLKPWLEKDDSFQTENYYPVLNAGELEGKQVIMPLSFNMMFGITTQELLDEAGIGLNTQTGELKDYLNALESAVNWKEENYLTFSAPAKNAATLCTLLSDFTGRSLVDVTTKEVHIPEELKQIADIVRQSNAILEAEQAVISKTYANDFVGRARHTIMTLYNVYPLVDTKLFDEAYRQDEPMEPRFFALPTHEGSDTYHAMVMDLACVNANTKNANAAYQLVRYLMDYDAPLPQNSQQASSVGIPVNRSVLEGQIQDTMTIGGQNIRSAGGLIPVSPLSEEHAQKVRDCLDRISSVSLFNPKVTQIFSDCMGPYLDGTTSDYEGCVKELENKLKLYVNE